MLDISKRITLIDSLIEEDTDQSLTYAALECRLTLEYLCYERFKFFYSYLSTDDLKNWQPRHVVKQISDDIDENIAKGFSVSISRQSVESSPSKTREHHESLEYIHIGTQSELNLKQLHTLWHSLANVALHIPVPSISSGNISIYGEKGAIRNKVLSVKDFLSNLNGNLLMGGHLGKIFSFNCSACDSLIKKPIESIKIPSIASCINPKCNESYILKSEDNGDKIDITRRIIKFSCRDCNGNLEVPYKVFRELRFDQSCNIRCGTCASSFAVIMRPLMKTIEDDNSHNNSLNSQTTPAWTPQDDVR